MLVDETILKESSLKSLNALIAPPDVYEVDIDILYWPTAKVAGIVHEYEPEDTGIFIAKVVFAPDESLR